MLTDFESAPPQERKTMTHSATEAPASSTPSLSRSSSISGTDNAGLHTFILSQVHTWKLKFQYLEIKTSLYIACVKGCDMTYLGLFIVDLQDDSLDQSLSTMSVSMSGTNVYEAARMSSGSSIMENLQSQLKLREGEIAQLQVAI